MNTASPTGPPATLPASDALQAGTEDHTPSSPTEEIQRLQTQVTHLLRYKDALCSPQIRKLLEEERAGRDTDQEREITRLQQQIEDFRRKVARLHQALDLAHSHNRGDVWYWQGDGTDELETLTCPVLIGPTDLAALIHSPTPAEPAEGPDAS